MTKTNRFYQIQIPASGYWFQDGKWKSSEEIDWKRSCISVQTLGRAHKMRKAVRTLMRMLPADVPFSVSRVWVPAARLKGNEKRYSFYQTFVL